MAKPKKSKKIHHSPTFLKKQQRIKDRFISLLTSTGLQYRACEMTPVNIATVFEWRHNDPVFEEAYLQADEMVGVHLEHEAIRRGREGFDEPLAHEGKLTGDCIRRYSDSLLRATLAARRREYRSKVVDETGSGQDAPITINLFTRDPNKPKPE